MILNTKGEYAELNNSSDYCVAELTIHNKKYYFYYGYEETYCETHGVNPDCDICFDSGCDVYWCFTVKEDGVEIYRSTLGNLEFGSGNTEETNEYLLRGILEWLQKK